MKLNVNVSCTQSSPATASLQNRCCMLPCIHATKDTNTHACMHACMQVGAFAKDGDTIVLKESAAGTELRSTCLHAETSRPGRGETGKVDILQIASTDELPRPEQPPAAPWLGIASWQGQMPFTGQRQAPAGGQVQVALKEGQGQVPFTGGQGQVPFTGGQGQLPFKGGQDQVPLKGGQGQLPFTGAPGQAHFTGGQAHESLTVHTQKGSQDEGVPAHASHHAMHACMLATKAGDAPPEPWQSIAPWSAQVLLIGHTRRGSQDGGTSAA
jgi:hypothetical protein